MSEIEAHLGGKKRRESQKTTVSRHEKELAEEMGGFAQPNSGALDHMKGDIKLDDFLIESKETEGVGIRIEGKDLTKICREANEINRHPAMVITIGDIASTTPKEWVLVPIDLFVENFPDAE